MRSVKGGAAAGRMQRLRDLLTNAVLLVVVVASVCLIIWRQTTPSEPEVSIHLQPCGFAKFGVGISPRHHPVVEY